MVGEELDCTSFDEAFGKLLVDPAYNPLSIGQFTMLGAWAFIYANSNYSWTIGGNGEFSTCPALRFGHHVPYARNNYMSLPKLDKTYFQEAARVIFEGDCRAQAACNATTISPECHELLAQKGPRHYELLSLEAQNEMEFGGGDSKPLAKKGCEGEVDRIYVEYEKCLVQRCPLR